MVPVHFGTDSDTARAASSVRAGHLVADGYRTSGVMDECGYVWYVKESSRAPPAKTPLTPYSTDGDLFLWRLEPLDSADLLRLQEEGYVIRNLQADKVWLCKPKNVSTAS